MRHEWKSHVDPEAASPFWVEIRPDGLWATNASEAELVKELHALAERVRDLEGEVAMRDGTLAMAVARLGGEVEGAPTHRGNFLQRIDELRQAEENLWAATITAEEGQEIEAEVTAALAALAGEALEPCAAGCPGHLGPKARAACREALDRWTAMEAERDEIDQILLEANLPPDRVRSAILYAQAGNEYGVPALKARIDELESFVSAQGTIIASLKEGTYAATLEAENRRLRERADTADEALATARNRVEVLAQHGDWQAARKASLEEALATMARRDGEHLARIAALEEENWELRDKNDAPARLLASESAPQGLADALADPPPHPPGDWRSGGFSKDAADAAWRWFRQQLTGL